jgi:hypothetical protein
MAGQGVLRSGQTASRLGAADLAKQQTIGGLQSQAEAQRRAIQDQTVQAQEQISSRRRGIEDQMRLAELGSYTALQQSKELQDINNQFSTYLNDLNIAASSKKSLMDMFGSLGQAGGMVAGYNMSGKSNSSPSSYSNNNYANGSMAGQTQFTNQPGQQVGVA